MSYYRCICQKCGSNYASMIDNDIELQKESCPGCGEKQLKISEPLTSAEINKLFYGGG